METGLRESQISRRDFLKAAGMGAAAVAAAGTAVGALTSCNSGAARVRWDFETDVVVVGSGAAASAAAVAARSQGVTVIMLEKSPITGGTTAKSGGVYWIPNNSFLSASGVQDNKDDCMRFLARGAYPQMYNPSDTRLGLPEHEYSLLSAFYDNGSRAIDFFSQVGALQSQQSALLPDYLDHVPENKVLRGRPLAPKTPTGQGAGAALVSQMKAWIDSHEIQVFTGHRVQEIVLDNKRQVIGLKAVTRDGKAVAVRGKRAVIFGSGGFTHNPQLILQFQLGPTYGGCAVPTNEGDFVYLAQAVGAQLSNMNGAWNAEIPLEQALQSPSTPNDIWQPAGDSMILVNKYGLRVTNEKRSYSDRTKIHFYWDPIHQEYPNQIMLMVYDQRTRDLYASAPGGYPIPTAGASSPDEISAQTLSQLGQGIRARVDQIAGRIGQWRLSDSFETNLVSTIARFNQFANKGVDEDFNRGDFPYDKEWHKNVFSIPAQGTRWPANDKPNMTMYPFTPQGPYYCILIAAGTLDTNGGPRTNELAQVLDTREKPIPGLYGAGNCIAAPTRYYFAAGGTLGPALTFGYIAGINAAKEPVK